MKKLSYLLSVIFIVAFSTTAFSQGMGGKGMRQGAGMNRAANLNLTTDQMTKMNELRNEFSKETLSLRTGLQAKSMEMRTLTPELEKNQTKIVSLQKEMSTLRLQLQEKKLQLRINARKVLTPEQIAMLPAGRGMGMGIGFASCNGMGNGNGRGKGMGNGRGGRGQGNRSTNHPSRY